MERQSKVLDVQHRTARDDSGQNVIEYQKTIGCESWVFGRLTDHGPFMIVAYLISAFVMTTTFSWMWLLVIGAAGYNDLRKISGKAKPSQPLEMWRFGGGGTPVALPSASEDWVEQEFREMESELQGRQAPVKSAVVTPPPVSASSAESSPRSPEARDRHRAESPKVTIVNEGVIPDAVEPKNDFPSAPESDFPSASSDVEIAQLLKNGKTGIAGKLLEREDGDLRSWMVTGFTGSGKGSFYAFALLLAINTVPNLAVYGIDPKGDPKELYRWQPIKEQNRYHFQADNPDIGPQEREMIEEGLKDLLRRYHNDPAPTKLLIVDELPAIISIISPKYRKQFVRFICNIGGMGRSRGRVCWVSSNTVGLREIGISKAERDYFHQMYLVTPGSYKKMCDHPSFPGPDIDMDVLNISGRAVWCNVTGEWHEVPTSYKDCTDLLKQIAPAPPKNFGTGEFAGAETALQIREVAKELAWALDQVEVNGKANLMDLANMTSALDGVDEDAIVNSVIPALKDYKDFLIIKKSYKGEWMCSLPEPEPDYFDAGLPSAVTAAFR